MSRHARPDNTLRYTPQRITRALPHIQTFLRTINCLIYIVNIICLIEADITSVCHPLSVDKLFCDISLVRKISPGYPLRRDAIDVPIIGSDVDSVSDNRWLCNQMRARRLLLACASSSPGWTHSIDRPQTARHIPRISAKPIVVLSTGSCCGSR